MPTWSDKRQSFGEWLDEATDQALKGEGVVRIGVTGTRRLNAKGRNGLTNLMIALAAWKGRYGVEIEIVQGGCVGADEYAAFKAKAHDLQVHTILPEDRRQVSPAWESVTDTWELGGDYRERNKKIVLRAGALFVCADYPEDDAHSRRSGTWMTARMAREAMKPYWRLIQHDTDDE
jgi:hypothetical protein